MVELACVLLGTCQNTHDLIAVDHGAILVHGETAVGVTVKSHAHNSTRGLDHGLQLLRMRGSGILIDVVTIRRRIDDGHVGARTT